MAVIDTAEFRKGLKIEIEGEPFVIVDFQHVKPGKGTAFVRTRIKSLTSGNVLERTFRSGDKVGAPDLEEKTMQYLYHEGDSYLFMDQSSYEQTSIDAEHLGDATQYLKDELVVRVLFHNGRTIGVELPTFVELKVLEAKPGVRGDTATGGTKPAVMESGVIVQVPLFVNEGEIIKVDTRDGSYVERVSK